MQKSILRSLAVVFTAAIVSFATASLSATEPTEPTTVSAPVPHCQVPCGIYTDQLRFEQMLEDTKTIAKSITSVETIAQAMKNGEQSPTNFNQMTRWINTKEDHGDEMQTRRKACHSRSSKESDLRSLPSLRRQRTKL